MTIPARTKLLAGGVGALAIAVALTFLETGGTESRVNASSSVQPGGSAGPLWSGPAYSLQGITVGPPASSESGSPLNTVAISSSQALDAASKAWPMAGAKVASVRRGEATGGPFAAPTQVWVVMYAPGAAPIQVLPTSGQAVVAAWFIMNTTDGSAFTMFSGTEPQQGQAGPYTVSGGPGPATQLPPG